MTHTSLGNIRAVETKNNDFYYEGNDVCAAIGYPLSNDGKARALKGSLNNFNPAYILCGADNFVLSDHGSGSTYAKWLTSESILNYIDHCPVKYERKAKQLVNELMNKEDLKMKPEKKESNVKQMDIKSIKPLDDGRFKIEFNDSPDTYIGKPDRHIKRKHGNIAVQCAFSGKTISKGDECYLFRMKRQNNNQRGLVLVSEISAKKKDNNDKPTMQSIEHGHKEGKYRIEWSVNGKSHISESSVTKTRKKAKHTGELHCSLSGDLINLNEEYCLFSVGRNKKTYELSVLKSNMPEGEAKESEQLTIDKITAIDQFKGKLSLLLSDSQIRELTYHETVYKTASGKCYFLKQEIKPGEPCYRFNVGIKGKQHTVIFGKTYFDSVVGVKNVLAKLEDNNEGLKKAFNDSFEELKENSTDEALYNALKEVGSAKEEENPCKNECKFERDYKGYILFFLALCFIIYQNIGG